MFESTSTWRSEPREANLGVIGGYDKIEPEGKGVAGEHLGILSTFRLSLFSGVGDGGRWNWNWIYVADPSLVWDEWPSAAITLPET